MTTLTRLAVQEWRLLVASRAVPVAFLLTALAAIYAAASGAHWVSTATERINEAIREEQGRLGALRAETIAIDAGRATPARFRDPTRAAWVGEFLGNRYAVWPPLPLTAWCIGQRDLLPSFLKVSTLSREAWMFEDEIEHPLHLALGRFDLAYVTVVLVPLVVLALSFDLLSGERERGTLPLVLSQGVSLGEVVAAKIVVRTTLAGLLFMVPVAVGTFTVPRDAWAPSLAGRVLLWSLTASFYGLCWVALAALTNLTRASSAANAVRLAAAWVLVVLTVPAGLSLVATSLYPAPSRLQTHERIRELRAQQASHLAALLEDYYRHHPDQRPETVDRTDWAPGYYAAQIRRDAEVEPLHDAHERQAAAQQAFADRWRWLSPASLALASFQDLAGTGSRDYRRFMQAVVEFHGQWRAFFYPRLFSRTRMTPRDYDQLPAFRFDPEPEGDVLRRVAGRLAVLTAVAAFLLGLCRWRVARSANGEG